MLSVVPVGSCRIATPLRLGSEIHGVEVNRARSFGFCHSSAEAVQMVRFLQGGACPPEALWPFIAKEADREAKRSEPPVVADLWVVEISSAKCLSIDGWAIQLNYLTSAFPDFFGETARAQQFWTLAQGDDAVAQAAFLEAAWPDRPENALLARVRLAYATPEGVSADIAWLMENLPNPLFVTHVNARRADGTPIPSRSRFIAMVRDAVEGQGGTVWDPTPLMEAVGQSAAIADNSTGLAHYTDAFARLLADEWFAAALDARIDAAVARGGSAALRRKLTPHVEARMAAGRGARLVPRLNKHLRRFPRDEGLVALHARASAMARRQEVAFAAALRVSGKAARLTGLTHATGGFADALPRLRNASVLAEPEALIGLAMAARTIGAGETALAYLSAALRPGRADLARRVARVLAAWPGATDLIAALEPRDSRRLAAFLPAALRLKVAVATADRAGTEARLAETEEADLLPTITALLLDGARDRVLDLLIRWREARDGQVLRDADLIARIEGAFDAQNMTTPELARLLDAHPRHNAARMAMRDLRRAADAKMRAAINAQDAEALDDLAQETRDLVPPLSVLPLARGRVRLAKGDAAAALDLAQDASAVMPRNVAPVLLALRAAIKLRDREAARKAALSVLDRAGPEDGRAAEEARLRLSQMAGVSAAPEQRIAAE
ncbi:MAG: hypothetical protein AAF919_08765 [Pseudomonadota bacterium]